MITTPSSKCLLRNRETYSSIASTPYKLIATLSIKEKRNKSKYKWTMNPTLKCVCKTKLVIVRVDLIVDVMLSI